MRTGLKHEGGDIYDKEVEFEYRVFYRVEGATNNHPKTLVRIGGNGSDKNSYGRWGKWCPHNR